MEIAMIFLTGTLTGALFLAAYRLGYRDGKSSKDDSVKISEADREMLRQYANFISYDGNERRR